MRPPHALPSGRPGADNSNVLGVDPSPLAVLSGDGRCEVKDEQVDEKIDEQVDR
jgi:hypothetical protein